MRKRKDEWMRKGDLSGWFVLALITPLGLDKLTDCHTYCHMQTHTHAERYFFSLRQCSILFAFCVCCVCEHTLCAWLVCADRRSWECVKGSL